MSTDTDTDAEAYVNSPSPGFLGSLASAPHSLLRRHSWRSPSSFLTNTASDFHPAVFENLLDNYFLLTGVTEEIFNAHFRGCMDDKNDPFAQWCAYDPALNLLLFHLGESQTHATVSPNFYVAVVDALRDIDPQLRLQVRLLGAATQGAPAPPEERSAGCKQPTASWAPKDVQYAVNSDLPTVVLEVACSEIERRYKLQSDVRFWLRCCEGYVKAVLTVVIRPGDGHITIAKWEKNEAVGSARVMQRIEITRDKRSDTVNVGPLVIEFENLFSRPISADAESDVM
ncbi:hypothetical protein ASPCAL10058 [Aspergillus calidoustus]|uniref:Uncharacterized protein n=1 Tax=Aspergillus calidoustus TaxID=454130 RepID=A0A0U5CBV2_ASPCI|nr:hypothetical protein ASPCAL10058 [Aspergillus calidoustus]